MGGGISQRPNFVSGTIWTGDNLDVMRGLNSNCVDLVYLDPPFNSNKNYEAPVGSKAAGAAFKDMWTLDDVKFEEHGLLADTAPSAYKVIEAARATAGRSMQAYLVFMSVRLLEMKRLLKESGSIFLHCDPTAGHYLKLLLDALFGRNRFRNEIVWGYTGPGSPKMRQFNRKHDTIYWYVKGDKWTFNKEAVRLPYKDSNQRPRKRFDTGGHFEPDAILALQNRGKIPESYWIAEKGNGLAIAARQKLQYTGYPTQKPLALLERIIRASSNEGDMVFDPFCGCATTLVVAQRLTRNWIGCDISRKAVELVNDRISETQPLFKAINPDKFPKRTDTKSIPNYKKQGHILYGRQEGICAGCTLHFPYGGMSIDHKHPQSKGGTDEMDNLHMLCMRCNSSKGNKTMAEWKAAKKNLL